MDREAAVISWSVEPATAFIVRWIVGWNNSLADPALFRVESLQPPACRLGHAVRHFAAGGAVLADYASIGHAGNLTREPGAREPLFHRRRTPHDQGRQQLSTSRSRGNRSKLSSLLRCGQRIIVLASPNRAPRGMQ